MSVQTQDAGSGLDLALPEAEVILYPDFFTPAESDAFFETLHRETAWRQETILKTVTN